MPKPMLIFLWVPSLVENSHEEQEASFYLS
uniref:Apt1 n=1 Tax=Arundo donax TaxID=35708 RepID=A0A0A9T5L2_ARUDO